LVDIKTEDKMEIVLQEIIEDKIYLNMSGEVKITGESTDMGDFLDLDTGDL
jgi:hypothetical protein